MIERILVKGEERGGPSTDRAGLSKLQWDWHPGVWRYAQWVPEGYRAETSVGQERTFGGTMWGPPEEDDIM